LENTNNVGIKRENVTYIMIENKIFKKNVIRGEGVPAYSLPAAPCVKESEGGGGGGGEEGK